MAVGAGCKAPVPAKGTGDGLMRPRDGRLDASPRGGEPGFVRVVDETTLWIPDAPGNNRLDSFGNIVETGQVGMLFLIPGIDETLRVNGRAHLSTDPDKREQLATPRWTPKVVVVVAVEEAFLHCPKALMRSKLWADESRQDRSVLPSLGQMLKDQTGSPEPAETQEEMLARYKPGL